MNENNQTINWFPGHMKKTQRQMEEELRQVDAVCELLDARIPYASRNPDLAALCGSKPRLVILNRIDLADPAATKAWAAHFRAQGVAVIQTDCKSRKGISDFIPAVRELLQEKLQRYAERGMAGKPLKLMVAGIPNVGKSTFINQIAGRKGAKAENRPGVTRGKQWVTVDQGLLLLDTPGILWPKFEDPAVGAHLAYTGAIRDEILDLEILACGLMELLYQHYPAALAARYRIESPEDETGYGLLELAGRKRGFLISGGEVDTERMARVLLEEFRNGKLGRMTLEWPKEADDASLGN